MKSKRTLILAAVIAVAVIIFAISLANFLSPGIHDFFFLTRLDVNMPCCVIDVAQDYKVVDEGWMLACGTINKLDQFHGVIYVSTHPIDVNEGYGDYAVVEDFGSSQGWTVLYSPVWVESAFSYQFILPDTSPDIPLVYIDTADKGDHLFAVCTRDQEQAVSILRDRKASAKQ